MRRLRNVRAAFALLTSVLATLGTAGGAPPAASEAQGDWRGAIDTGTGSLRVVFHLTQDADGKLMGTMDSPDQGAMGIALSYVSYTQPDVHLTIARFGGEYEGKLDKEFKARDAQVLGVSVDSVPSHVAWQKKDIGMLNYPLGSDFYPHGETAKKFGDCELRRSLGSERLLRHFDHLLLPTR